MKMSDGEKENVHIKFDFENEESSFLFDDATIDMDDPRFSYVSFSRGSERNSSNRKCRGWCSFLDECDDTVSRKRLSFTNLDISDADFFDSDSGKEMILKDQERMLQEEQEATLPCTTADCTGCSAWVPLTSKKLPNLAVTIDTDFTRSQLNVSVGEYINKRSEYLGNLYEGPVCSKEFFGCDASSPARIRSEVSSIDKSIRDLADKEVVFQKWSFTPKHHEYKPDGESFPLSSTLIYSVTPKTPKIPDPLHYFIGTTCYKNIQKLREKERIGSNCLTESVATQANQSLENFTRNSKNSSSTGKERWTVRPEVVVLDVTKGSRVQLINSSTRDIKFKVKFDGHVINVCPLIGTVRAKNEIGLRVQVLRSSIKPIGNIQTTVEIYSGNTVKTVHVKIARHKSKTPVKQRSFILH